MNVDEKIESIKDYFVEKVIKGDYKFIKCDDHNAEILIDDKYNFQLWIANGPTNIDFYYLWIDKKYLMLPLLKTQKERQKAWGKINKYIKEYKKVVLRKEKQKQIEKLTAELKKL